jgi:DNA processing protein
MFGLPNSEVLPLLQAVVGCELSETEASDSFARAAWTGIAEPGDRIAGVLVRVLGAASALQALVDRVDATPILAAMARHDSDDLTIAELTQGLERFAPRMNAGTALLALKQAARWKARLLVPDVLQWPTGLADLGDHGPIALWVRGTDEAVVALSRSIALVGARAATGYGEHVTMEASAGLVDRGLAIVSGAAYGIDGMAHRAALASHGMTVAFLAGGVDRFYPSGHDSLLTRIVDNGAVISELPCGAPPTKWRFLQRNRLIAAVSQATVVLEAGWRSGSLNTAGHASALGRPLGAVPGPVTSAASAGCHRLIREFDAVCVTNPDEMLELMPVRDASLFAEGDALSAGEGDVLWTRDGGANAGASNNSQELRVLDALSDRSPRTIDDVARRAGLGIAETQTVLGMLGLEGTANARERGWVKQNQKRA